MKRSIILAALILSMAVTVFAEEELIWEEQAAVEETYAFEAPTTSEEQIANEEQIASEVPEYVFEEQETIEEQITEEDVVSEEIAFDENADQATELIQEESVFEEDVVTEETAGDESASSATAVAVEGLVYTGEPQALILPQPGSWTYSLDGEHFTDAIPTAINAGTYTVYLREGDKDPVSITVTIAKADVVFTPPVANTTAHPDTGEAGDENEEPGEGAAEPAYAAGEENEVGEGATEPAYSGDEPAYADEVVFE